MKLGNLKGDRCTRVAVSYFRRIYARIILEQSSGWKIALYQTRVLSPGDVNLMFTVCLSLSRSIVISTQHQSSTFHISFCSGRAVSGSFHGPGCSIVYYESIKRGKEKTYM